MSDAYFGQWGIPNDLSFWGMVRFIVHQEIGLLRTGVPVKVIAVHGGGVGAPPTVDVQPLVNQIDGVGNKTDHGTIYGLPVARNQGGLNAIINDPKVNDIGHVICSDRDTSSLRANHGSQSNPGSFRRHNLADGVYHAAILNPANPDQAVQFTDTGFKVFDKNGNIVELKPGEIHVTGNLHVTGEVIAGYGGGDQVSLQTHVHSGVTTGGADTAAPVPGT